MVDIKYLPLAIYYDKNNKLMSVTLMLSIMEDKIIIFISTSVQLNSPKHSQFTTASVDTVPSQLKI